MRTPPTYFGHLQMKAILGCPDLSGGDADSQKAKERKASLAVEEKERAKEPVEKEEEADFIHIDDAKVSPKDAAKVAKASMVMKLTGMMAPPMHGRGKANPKERKVKAKESHRL